MDILAQIKNSTDKSYLEQLKKHIGNDIVNLTNDVNKMMRIKGPQKMSEEEYQKFKKETIEHFTSLSKEVDKRLQQID